MKFLSSEKLSPHKYKTPEGYLICTDAILARTGKQTYRKNEVFADSEDDSEIDVDRKPEEVFSPKTLASFENKPITVEHPDEDVNAGNYNELSVGFVRDVRRGQVDGQDVMLGTLVITDAQTIEEIENGEHTDLSCGYDCDIVDEANPQQRNIRGNHVALCQQGRAGIARIVDSTKIKDGKYIVHFKHKNGGEDKDIVVEAKGMTEAVEIAKTYVSDYYYKYVNVKPYYEDSIKDDYFTSLPDRVKKSEFNNLYYKIREKAEDKWNYRVSTYGDKFKIEIEKAVGAAPGTYGPVGGKWKTVKTIYSIEDSIKDEDIFKVDVSSAEDRDISRFINEAQNLGFITEDKGYTIYLKNGNRDMLNRLKARTYTTDIKFVDSTKDSTYVTKDKSEIINILNKWSDNPNDSIDIIMPGGKFIRIFKDKFNNNYTAWTSKLSKKEFDKPGKAVDYIVLMGLNELLNDSVKDTEYRIVNYNNNWYYEIKQDDGFTKLVGPYTSQEEAKKYFMKHRPNEKLKDAQSVIFRGENTFIFENKDEIPEKTHYKEEVDYNGNRYYLHEGFDTKRNYLVPIVDSVKDDLVCGYTEQDLRIAKNMLSKAVSENEKKLIESLIAKIKYELTNQEMRDSYDYIGNAMIFKSLPKIGEKAQKYGFGYSDSVISKIEKTYNKDGYQFYIVYCMDEDDYKNNRETQYHYSIAIKDSSNTSIAKDSSIKDAKWDKNTLVKAFKLYGNALGSEAEEWAEDVVQNGPKNIDELDYWFNHQATIISRDNMRNVINYLKAHNALRDTKKYEISYVKDNIEHINIVKASSLQDAIKKVKDDNDLNLLRQYFKETQPNKKMELRHKLKEMGYKEGISGVNSRELMWVELNGKRYEVKNLSTVREL